MTGLQNSHNPDFADYDWRMFALMLRERLQEDGSGYRALAPLIGISLSDLSRAATGQTLSAPKVIAICDWMKISVRVFYLSPMKSNCFSESSVKHISGEAS